MKTIQDLQNRIDQLDSDQCQAAPSLLRSFKTATCPDVWGRSEAALTILLGEMPPHFYAILESKLVSKH